jgi:hypothetical protein
VANGTRTRDHRDHNPGLYQLSYRHRESRYRVAGLAAERRLVQPLAELDEGFEDGDGARIEQLLP